MGLFITEPVFILILVADVSSGHKGHGRSPRRVNSIKDEPVIGLHPRSLQATTCVCMCAYVRVCVGMRE